jgi:glutaredoxin
METVDVSIKKARSRSRRRKKSSKKGLSRTFSKLGLKSSKKKKSKRRSSKKKKSKRRSSTMHFNTPEKSKVDDPLSIYTKDGCGACQKAKDLMTTNNIKFIVYQKKDYEDTLKILTNDYKYAPVIIDRNNKFIGGYEDLRKILQ